MVTPEPCRRVKLLAVTVPHPVLALEVASAAVSTVVAAASEAVVVEVSAIVAASEIEEAVLAAVVVASAINLMVSAAAHHRRELRQAHAVAVGRVGMDLLALAKAVDHVTMAALPMEVGTVEAEVDMEVAATTIVEEAAATRNQYGLENAAATVETAATATGTGTETATAIVDVTEIVMVGIRAMTTHAKGNMAATITAITAVSEGIEATHDARHDLNMTPHLDQQCSRLPPFLVVERVSLLPSCLAVNVRVSWTLDILELGLWLFHTCRSLTVLDVQWSVQGGEHDINTDARLFVA